ncbi:hypothetical protein [Lentilactobacillus senioris]|uniref:hypothetical protein n=1 Tax=Lentilactobacillus senioris TaxID=931534 RepID=UPI003D2C11C5
MAEAKKNEAKKTQAESMKETFNKYGKQKNYTYENPDTNEKLDMILNFPGTFRAAEITDSLVGRSMSRNGADYNANLMESVIISPKMDWNYWDEKLADDEKVKTVEIDEGDGTKATYTLTWPGYEIAQRLIDARMDFNDTPQPFIANQGLMDEVIKSDQGKVDYNYWDKHIGMNKVFGEANNFINELISKNGYVDIMDEADTFLGEMVNK